MKHLLLLLLLLGAAVPLPASHQWAGIDLCEVRKDVVPPGLPPELLPEPGSAGARLLQHYCAQCHNLPGPGRHTVEQWPEVAERMFRLMDVFHRFPVMGKVETPTAAQRGELLGYLQEHALRPWSEESPPPEPYRSQCGECHSPPDPAHHSVQQWPRVLARMQRNREIMGKAPPEPAAMAVVRRVLGVAGQADTGNPQETPAVGRGMGPWLALGPYLILTGVGLWRWWRASGRKDKPCATP